MVEQFVFVVHMARWGDIENHSYVSGVYSTLKKALSEGIQHADFRADKYEPVIYMISIDGDTHNKIVTNLDEALALMKEFEGKSDETPSI